jgi:hypothetical protein
LDRPKELHLVVSAEEMEILQGLRGSSTWRKFLLEPYLHSVNVLEQKEKGE